MKDFIKETFEEMKMSKDKESNWYINGTFEAVGAVIMRLADECWFMNNVKTWLLYNTQNESVENVIEEIKDEI